MNNKNNNQDVFECYVDATVALFMEHYSAMLSDNIRAEMEKADVSDIIFPAALDKRCRDLIKKECARRNRKQYLKDITKGFKYVAIFSVTLFSLVSLLFISVEAFRAAIINYCIEHSDVQWDINVHQDSNSNIEGNAINIADPLAGIIPEQYSLVVLDGDSLSEMTAIYEDFNGKQIYFSATTGDSWVTVDSEDAQTSQTLQISGHDAVLVVEEENIRVAWICKETSTVFTVIANGLTETEVINIAAQFISLVSK